MIIPRSVLLTTLLVAATAGTASAAPGILYSVDSRGARVLRANDGVRLSLPARAPTTWFTDRPGRQAGMTTIGNLAAIWAASGFADDPPNAALLLTGGGERRTHVVEMQRPRRSGDGRRVSFRIRAIDDASEAGHTHTHPIEVGRYRRALVFIDDAALPPCGVFITGPRTCLLTAWNYSPTRRGDANMGATTAPGSRTTTLRASACRIRGTAAYSGPGVNVVDTHTATVLTISLAPCPAQTTLVTPTSATVVPGGQWWVINYGTEAVQLTVR